jgi:hypothetical protein
LLLFAAAALVAILRISDVSPCNRAFVKIGV